MSISVVEAEVEQNLELFQTLLNRNRNRKVGRNRFEWLYLYNPQGGARAWFVEDRRTGEPVAFTSVLPRLVKVDGTDIVCWNCCDFSVDRKYRTLGVALKLRKKAKECVDNGEVQALYAHPNDRMEVIHKKVGHLRIGQMRRFVKLLRSERQIEKFIKNKFLSSFLSPSANLFLGVKDKLIKIDKRYSVQWLENQEFDDEYDCLFEEASRGYRILGDRRASYLNWRYGQNPLYLTHRVTIRNEGKLVGYVLFHLHKGVAVLKDILCMPDDNVLNTLLGHAIRMLRARRIDAISAIFMDKNPVVRSLEHLGFRRRPEVSSVYAYAREDDHIRRAWVDGKSWYMTVADRDL